MSSQSCSKHMNRLDGRQTRRIHFDCSHRESSKRGSHGNAAQDVEPSNLRSMRAGPSLVAIKWATPLDDHRVASVLSGLGLSLATEGARAERRRTGPSRDPVQPSVNQTSTLTWARGTRLTEAALGRIEEGDGVEWVAPTYRATQADKGPQSYFAVKPTTLLLTAAAATAVGDITSLDPSASVDARRSQLLKGFVVFNLPNGNAIELAENRQVGGCSGCPLREHPLSLAHLRMLLRRLPRQRSQPRALFACDHLGHPQRHVLPRPMGPAADQCASRLAAERRQSEHRHRRSR